MVSRDHNIFIPKRCPLAWIGVGPAWLAPLSYKRTLLIDEGDQVHVWSLFNDKIGTENWMVQPKDRPALCFSTDLKLHKPSGWEFLIPEQMRNRGWLPKSGQAVIREIGEDELNIWCPITYDIESIREASE